VVATALLYAVVLTFCHADCATSTVHVACTPSQGIKSTHSTCLRANSVPCCCRVCLQCTGPGHTWPSWLAGFRSGHDCVGGGCTYTMDKHAKHGSGSGQPCLHAQPCVHEQPCVWGRVPLHAFLLECCCLFYTWLHLAAQLVVCLRVAQYKGPWGTHNSG
jgi:hypothetical protein